MPQSVHAFAEKVALITDGTSPIGRAVALQLALQGALNLFLRKGFCRRCSGFGRIEIARNFGEFV